MKQLEQAKKELEKGIKLRNDGMTAYRQAAKQVTKLQEEFMKEMK